jgi:para-aminobenzoate synthetase component 1
MTALPRRLELPYPADSAALFEPFADEPWACFLDSATRDGRLGRYDVLVADPAWRLECHGGVTSLTGRDGLRRPVAGGPLAALRDLLGPPALPPADLPFVGGAVGYFGYDLGWWLDEWPSARRAPAPAPEMAVGIYDWAVVVDHRRRRAELVAADRDPHTAAVWPSLVQRLQGRGGPPRVRFRAAAPWRSNLTADAYRERVERVLAYLRAGDCYQVNLAQTFSCPAVGDPWEGYRRLRQSNPAPFAAYLNLPWAHYLCASPERFLRVQAGGAVETRPIKGTRPRSADPLQDAQLARDLLANSKERAENLMIVDLLRNDLGRVCRSGSVRVPELFAVKSYASVHHLVSTVVGQLAPGRDPLDLLAAALPGGSITGAPKRRAMEVIAELEPEPRGIYCGSIGYLGFDGRMDSNVVIRTLEYRDGSARVAAGGGIVVDSDPAREYQETLTKADRLLRLLDAD